MITILAFIFVFGLLVVGHELGHYLVAKLVGIRVEEFSVGFGRPLLRWQRGETMYGIRMLPLGGFVRMTGEDGAETTDPRSFANRPVLQRMAVVLAGPVMNVVLAVVLFGMVFFMVGVPSPEPVLGGIMPQSPAAEAGLEAGDLVVAVDGNQIDSWEDLARNIRENQDRPLELEVQREERTLMAEVTPEVDESTGFPVIGIERDMRSMSALASLGEGLRQTVDFTYFILATLVQMVTGQVPADVAGPVGIAQIVGEVARTGLVNLLTLAAVLSINLAIFNLFPIPVLDGGQILFLALEGLRGRPLDPDQEGYFRYIGIFLLLLLLVAVTLRDIARISF